MEHDMKNLEQKLVNRIREEAQRERRVKIDELLERVWAGDGTRVIGNLLLHTDPDLFDRKLSAVLEALGEPNVRVLSFLMNLAIDLGSFLPEWNTGLPRRQISAAGVRVNHMLDLMERREPQSAGVVHAAALRDTLGRLTAEAVMSSHEREKEATGILGGSLVEYVKNSVNLIERSNFLHVGRARKSGKTETEFGNDYAAFLRHVIRLGGSFATTNPVLIKVAWDTNPEIWNDQVDRLILSRYSAEEIRQVLAGKENQLDAVVSDINSIVTMAVVVENCKLLRDIFLVTEGREGYVSLQVNPKMHDDPIHMVAEARSLYRELMTIFGGVPNVVFKLPSTAAGLKAAEILSVEGIGVTITLTFSVFQASGFARILSRGCQLVSYIAIMNGRMAFPARDELKDHGIPGGEAAARWAGVEVARKTARHLYGSGDAGGLGIDRKKIKIMIASLRDYDDWFPDISELWGIPLITVFPNIRRAYDVKPRSFEGHALNRKTPEREMTILRRSQIFRQAWWLQGDEDDMHPEQPISLDDVDREILSSWPPFADTLNQFIDMYEEMKLLVIGRMRYIVGP